MNLFRVASATALSLVLSMGHTQALAQVPDTQLPAFFERLNPSVVEVQLHKPNDNRTYSKGSGFVSGSDRWIVTNFHVIDTIVFETAEGVELWVNGTDGFRTRAQVVLVDMWNDLALLKLEQPIQAPLLEVNPALPERGERGYTLGSQLDNHTVLAEGIFNGVDDRDEDAPVIMFTGPVNAGMSGGPVVDAQGMVRGVNHMRARNFKDHDYGDDHTGKDSRCRIGHGLPFTDAPEAGYGMLRVLWLQTPEMGFFARRSFLERRYARLFASKERDPHEFMGHWHCNTTDAKAIAGTNMRIEFCEREMDKLDGLAHYAVRGLSLNGGSEHALFSLLLEGYSLENAEKLLNAVLEKISFKP